MDKSLAISCKCTTYGRVNVLEELLYSFLHLEYEGWKELVIVNDYPLQKLHFDHPEVRIYNLDETFPIIGEKENYTINLCEGDVIAVDFNALERSKVLTLTKDIKVIPIAIFDISLVW